jgi:hypothetical protein
MLSRSSFKAELIEFRNSRKPARFNKKGKLVEPGNRNTADLQIIERWINHPDREAIWKAISHAAPNLQPAQLIKEVLRARRKAQSHVNQMYGATNIKGGYPVRFAGFQDEWNALRKKGLSAEVLLAANLLYIRAYDVLDDEYQPSRQDIRGSRLLRLFSEIIGDYLQATCGGWLDVQTAQLAEIALDLEPGGVSSKALSDARRPRPKKMH